MAVPFRNVLKKSQGTRRAHMALTAKTTVACPNCGEMIKPHRVCPKCGYYKKEEIIKKTEEK